MERAIMGAGAAILLMAGGLYAWQVRSEAVDPLIANAPPALSVPVLPDAPAGDAPKFGTPPPAPPEAKKESREVRRFNRYDRNRDELISRLEMMSTRTSAFKRLDEDGNNLLSFEEWAISTSERFHGANSDRSVTLTRKEFATTAPKASPKKPCRC